MTSGAVWRFLALFSLCLAAFLGRGLLSDGYYDSANLLLGHFPWRSELPMPPLSEMNPSLTDQPTQFLLWHRFAAEQIRAGELPLWNPWSGAGRPLLANSQSAVFSPANFGHYLLSERVGLLWAAAWRLLCAGLGMWYLARRLGLGAAAAAFAGVAFAFSGPMVVWLGHPQSAVFATLPWLLAAAHALACAPGPWPAAGAAGAVTLAFVAGHPESTFHVIFFAALWGVWLLCTIATRKPATVLWTAVGVSVGLAAAAAHWVPFVEYLAHSDAWAIRATSGGDGGRAAPLVSLVAWFLPDQFGHPQGNAFALAPTAFHDIAAYAGLGVPLLLIAAVRERRMGRAAGGLLAVGGVAAMAVYGVPPVSWALDALPLFRSAYNNRLLVVAVCAGILAAAHTVDALGQAQWPRRYVLVTGAAGVVLLLVALLTRLGETGSFPLSSPALLRAGLVLVAGAGVIGGGLGPWGLVAIAAADVVTWGYRFNPVTPAEQHFPTTPFIAQLRAELATDSQSRMLARGYVFPSETAMRYGIHDVKSWDAVEPARYAAYMDIARDTGHGGSLPALATTRLALLRVYRSRLLDGAAAAVVLSQEPLHDAGYERFAQAPGVFAYRNHNALPRARLAPAVEVLPNRAAVEQRLREGHDPARVTLLEGTDSTIEAGGSGRVTFLTDDPGSVRLAVETDRPAVLVLADVMLPGWSARVDGQPTEVWYADLAFRAVAIPPGTHTVEFRYQPLGVRVGLGMSAAGLAGLCVLGLLGAHRRRAGSTTVG